MTGYSENLFEGNEEVISQKIKDDKYAHLISNAFCESKEESYLISLLSGLGKGKIPSGTLKDLKQFQEGNKKYNHGNVKSISLDILSDAARKNLKEAKVKKHVKDHIFLEYDFMFSGNTAERKKQEDVVKSKLEATSYEKLVDIASSENSVLSFLDKLLQKHIAYETLQEKVQDIDPVIDSLITDKKDIQTFLTYIEGKDVEKIITYLEDNNVDDAVKLKALKKLGMKLSYKDALDYGIISGDDIEKKVKSLFPGVDLDTKNDFLSDAQFLKSLPFDLDVNKISESDILNKLLAHSLIETYATVEKFKKEIDDIENEEDFGLEGVFDNIKKKTGKQLDELDMQEGNFIVFNTKNANDNTKNLGGIISIQGFSPETIIEGTSQKKGPGIDIEFVSHNDNIIPSGSRKKQNLTLDQFQKLLINAHLQGDFEMIYDKNEGNLRKNIQDLGYGETETLVYGQKTIGQVNESLDFLDSAGNGLHISNSSLPIGLKFTSEKGQIETFHVTSYSDSDITISGILGEEVLGYDDFILAFKSQNAKRFQPIKSQEGLLDSLKEVKGVGEKWESWKVGDAGNNKGFQKSYKETDKTVIRELKYVHGKDDMAFEVVSMNDNQVVVKEGELKEPTKSAEGKDKNYKGSFSSQKTVLSLDQFLAIVKNYGLSPVDDLGKEVESIDNEAEGKNGVQKSFFRSMAGAFFQGLSIADIKDGGKKFIEHIESNLKDAAYFKAEKAAYQYAKMFGLGDDFRIKLESRMSSKIDEIKDTLKSVAAGARQKRIEKMMSNSNATTEEKIAAVLAILEKYGSLNAKGAGEFPLGTWYEFMGGKKGDKLWQEELERSQDPSLDVPFNEVNVIMHLVNQWGKDGITGTNVYKKIKASRPNGFKEELSTGLEDAASLNSASAKKDNFLEEFGGNTYPNAIGNVKDIIKTGKISSNTDMAFYSNIMLLTGASDRFDELALKEFQGIAYSGTCPSYIFLMKSSYMKVYRETLNALFGEKYGATLKKLMGNDSMGDKVKIFDEFWSSHGDEINNAMNAIGDYTLLKRRDEEPFKSYLSIIYSQTDDMGGELSNYPTSMKQGGWAAMYNYDTFKKVEFDNGGGYRGNTEYIIKGTTNTLKDIANSDLTNHEKATFMSETALKLSRALLEKTKSDAPYMKTFYESIGKWGKLEKLGMVKIENSEASPDTVESTHYDKMYNSILQKLNQGVNVKDYSDDDETEEELVEFKGSTQDYVGELLKTSDNSEFASEVPDDIQVGLDKYKKNAKEAIYDDEEEYV